MSWSAQTLSDFGRQMGMEDLSFNHNGVARFDFADGGSMGIELKSEVVLIYLIRPLGYHGETARQKALRLADRRQGWSMPIQVGCMGANKLIFLTRLPERSFTLPALEEALDLLNRLHQMAQDGR
ncbi:type III secretion chaperone SycN [Parachitinimonas caeni]|uniref:Type III secretion chaperone SycN n=1 Tax=Parachitinimonas caeni TaxID=3031301 RepID=A0ABT7DTT7_9NEIS|nr:type III secretion chaperone SycN [Parachitinimonas caeni]MDK2123483.1 type III secretion chaperone SycN [Parachitinimonas caeni]